ncbi:MAG: tRNA lysidine(34) synthetase TilS [Rhodobacteraceae bacterium]|nr:tRNA lysidine(34) synthetase TilS [Paracoccaceae bacterium]
MAVLHLLTKFWDVEAVTVDHRLRAEAAEEAEFVAASCAKLGVPHHVLVWRHGKITGNLQDAARRARYDLIAKWAKRRGLAHVALGHTADDQAETFLMRLARQSGVDGLSGMKPRRKMAGITFHRPFLSFQRQELRSYLRRHDIAWIEDPSNADERFDRIKARRALAALAPLGIGPDELSGVAHNLQMERSALRHCTAAEFARIGAVDRGDLVFEARELARLHPEINRRLLIAALRWISEADYAPRAEALIKLQTAIRHGKSHTLHGCRILTQKKTVRITREARAVRDTECGTRQLWDGRWKLRGPHSRTLRVRALGAAGLAQCPDRKRSGLPRASLLASPGIWHDNNLVAAPLANMGDIWRAELAGNRDDFASFLLSH